MPTEVGSWAVSLLSALEWRGGNEYICNSLRFYGWEGEGHVCPGWRGVARLVSTGLSLIIIMKWAPVLLFIPRGVRTTVIIMNSVQFDLCMEMYRIVLKVQDKLSDNST